MTTQIDWISRIASKQIDDHHQASLEWINLKYRVDMQGFVIVILVVAQVAMFYMFYMVYGN